MERPEYIQIHAKHFSEEMKHKYNINKLIAEDGFVYCKINCGMYSLKQAARFVYDNLVRNLKQDDNYPDKYFPNIWSHESRDTKFCLCVDHDFGVKYLTKIDTYNLITTLQFFYDITIDWSGENFCGFDIAWDYDEKYVDISMKHFVIKTLQRLQHIFPTKP